MVGAWHVFGLMNESNSQSICKSVSLDDIYVWSIFELTHLFSNIQSPFFQLRKCSSNYFKERINGGLLPQIFSKTQAIVAYGEKKILFNFSSCICFPMLHSIYDLNQGLQLSMLHVSAYLIDWLSQPGVQNGHYQSLLSDYDP